MMALARSVDLSWSPPPYCTSTMVTFGCLAFICFTNPSPRSIPVRLVWSWTMAATSPLSPMSWAILSAAKAAAATLSVAAVATGMSLSTPESKPTTGILASKAFLSSGMAALESRAAKQMACGFLASAAWSISICQNWCWNPLEMTGM
jgi:hypothetical protein